MATYYVRNLGAGDGSPYYYKADAWPTDTVNDGSQTTLNALLAVLDGGGHTIVFAGGTYVLTTTADTAAANTTIRPVLTTDPEDATYGGDVVFNGNNGARNLFVVDQTGWVIGERTSPYWIHFTGAASGTYYGLRLTAIARVNRVKIYNNGRGLYSSARSIFSNIRVYDNIGSDLLMSAGVVNFSQIHIGASSSGSAYISAGVVLNNCLLSRKRSLGFENASASTTAYIKNSVFIDAYLSNVSDSQAFKGSGIIELHNSLIYRNPMYPVATLLGANATETGCLHVPMKWTADNRPSGIVFCVDDYSNLDYFKAVSAKIAAHGGGATWGLNSVNNIGAEGWASIAQIDTTRHEIANHGIVGNDITDLNGITVQYTGTATTAVMSITSDGNWATRLQVTLTGSTDDDVDLDISQYPYFRLSDVAEYLNGLGCFTATNRNADSGTGTCTFLSAGSWDVNGADVAVDYDTDHLYYGNFEWTREQIQQNLGYIVQTWISPGNELDEPARVALEAAGYIGGRGHYADTNGLLLESFNVFNMKVLGLNPFFGSDNEPHLTAGKVNAYIGSLCEMLKLRGGIVCLYAHDVEEITLDAWDHILDAVLAAGVPMLTLSQAAILATTYDPSDDIATTDNMTYTRTMLDSANWAPPTNSVLIGHGVTPFVDGDGDVYDAAGVKVWDDITDAVTGPWANGPTVGAYAVAAPFLVGPWTTFDSTLPALTLSPDCPGKLKQVQEWRKVASAREIERY